MYIFKRPKEHNYVSTEYQRISTPAPRSRKFVKAKVPAPPHASRKPKLNDSRTSVGKQRVLIECG